MQEHGVRPFAQVNRATGLGRFLRALHDDAPWPTGAPDARDPRQRISSLVPPSAFNFAEFLEPGIRDLVLAVTRDGGLLTYSSCEGHHDPENGVASPASVGFLATDDDEYLRLHAALQRLAESVNAGLTTGSACSAAVNEARIESEVGEVPVLDLWFLPRADWSSYFRSLPTAISVATSLVAHSEWL